MRYPKVKVKKSFAGLGLFAAEDIKQGTKITQYIGKIIPNQEADRKPNPYIFEMDENFSIDGSPLYNLARYINHSCNPNALSASYKNARHKIFIEARRDIKKGEEITIDYGEEHKQMYFQNGCLCPICRNL